MGLIKTLRETEPFNQLPEEIFTELNQSAQIKKFPAQTLIFNQHDQPTGYLYVIKSGLVEIVVQPPGEVEMIVDYRKAGAFFGGTPVFTSQGYSAGARTVKETECYQIPEPILTRIATNYPHITDFFNQAIYSRVRSLYSDMVSEHAQNALTQMEAYPFKKRLSEIMSTPVITCTPETSIQEISRKMIQQSISAILVCDKKNQLLGIVTEKDLVAKVLARETVDFHTANAGEVMSHHPYTMAPDTFMYEATTFMMGHKIKHLPILDQGEIVGIVSLQDLMKYRSQKSMLLIGNVNKARTVEDLIFAREEIVKVARALLGESRSHIETMEIISYIHHRIIQRCYEIVLDEMQRQGKKQPDIKVCFIIMGSGGRKEMLLGPDQDNGFIYENFPDDKIAEVDAFFIPFAEKLVAALARIGYPRCKGNVMVNNPLWRGRLGEWQERVSDWIRVPEAQKVRYSSIFLDFMPIAGEASLCQDLREIVHHEIKTHPIFLYHMMELDFKHKVPLSLIGRFSLEREKKHKGQLSIKQAGSIFIVDCVRMFLLEQQVEATTTTERLDQLVKLKVFNPETAEHIKAAFEAFTFLRLRNEISLIDQGKFPSHYLDPYALTKMEQDLLKEAFRVASKLQDSTKRHFSKIVG
ncbi:MAG: putative nucleotidyltransferase substrate binding domain-containing protein [Thermodesulfobacteriota bacterium]|nr:putative nucleotidyltransferase substrate binding domain-containing protein [Thermodesulfobacteriota bacterium]